MTGGMTGWMTGGSTSLTAVVWNVLPGSVMHSRVFLVLSTFVALNTVMYVGLAVVKMLPRIHVSDWIRGPERRSETRHIDPDAPA